MINICWYLQHNIFRDILISSRIINVKNLQISSNMMLVGSLSKSLSDLCHYHLCLWMLLNSSYSPTIWLTKKSCISLIVVITEAHHLTMVCILRCWRPNSGSTLIAKFSTMPYRENGFQMILISKIHKTPRIVCLSQVELSTM